VDVLVVDVGGSHVKLMATGAREPRRFDSGPELTPEVMVDRVRELTRDWEYEAVSLGYPGAVDASGPTAEPGNLGRGWVGFDYEKAFGTRVRIVNDAVMQALGGYDGGRMLFLGFGTGLGSSLITEHVVIPLELGCLPFGDETLAARLGREGLETSGREEWLRTVGEACVTLLEAFAADYVLLGGGNARKVDPLPAGARRGGNDDAFTGGFRLWEQVIEPHDRQPPPVWRVVR
jgi:polyphosphate glucokinase